MPKSFRIIDLRHSGRLVDLGQTGYGLRDDKAAERAFDIFREKLAAQEMTLKFDGDVSQQLNGEIEGYIDTDNKILYVGFGSRGRPFASHNRLRLSDIRANAEEIFDPAYRDFNPERPGVFTMIVSSVNNDRMRIGPWYLLMQGALAPFLPELVPEIWRGGPK